jgi:hypothetical protein
MRLLLCGTLFHLAQIVEPHISTDDHVQVAVPRVLGFVRAKCLPSLEVHIPCARNKCLALVAVVHDVCRCEQRLEDSPRK